MLLAGLTSLPRARAPGAGGGAAAKTIDADTFEANVPIVDIFAKFDLPDVEELVGFS